MQKILSNRHSVPAMTIVADSTLKTEAQMWPVMPQVGTAPIEMSLHEVVDMIPESSHQILLDLSSFHPTFKKCQAILRSPKVELNYLSDYTSAFELVYFFFFCTCSNHNKGRLIAGMEKPMVWSGLDSPSSSVCLMIKTPFQFTWAPVI